MESILDRLVTFMQETHFDESTFSFMQSHCAKFRKGETTLDGENTLLQHEVYQQYLALSEELLGDFLAEEGCTAESLFERLQEEGAYERGDMQGAALRGVIACTEYREFVRQMLEISEDFFGDSTSEEYTETDESEGEGEGAGEGLGTGMSGGDAQSNGGPSKF